jgi:uncharacterized protein (TIGR03086 family)
MPETDRRPFLVRSYDLAAEVAAGVRPDQLATPTPCAQFHVAALVDHLVGAGWRAVALGRGEPPSGTGEFPHVALEDAPAQLRKAGDEAGPAWAGDGTLTATTAMPWGETYTGATLVAMYLAEMTAHTWDLAAATGQLGSLDPALAGPALEGARAMLKPEYRDAGGPGSPYGPEVEPPDGATAWEQLAAFTGRHPRTWRHGPS